jgi:hypothetical protein
MNLEKLKQNQKEYLEEYDNDMKQGQILFKKHKTLLAELLINNKDVLDSDCEILNDADIEAIGKGIEIIKEIAKLQKDINVIHKKHNQPITKDVVNELLPKVISEYNEIQLLKVA